MFFWIFVSLIVVVPFVVGFLFYRYEKKAWRAYPNDFWFGYGITIFITFFASVFAFVIIGATNDTGPKFTEKYELQSISVGSGIRGNFFLGSGTVSGKRQLNYIEKYHGYSLIKQSDADGSRIYTDENNNPYVLVHMMEHYNPWVAPWSWGNDVESRDFHIPKDSIISDYKLEN